MGRQFQFWKMKSSGDGRGDDCTTMSMYLVPLNCTLKKMAKMVNFILRVLFYHNEKYFGGEIPWWSSG